jgi:hypothetical protein
VAEMSDEPTESTCSQYRGIIRKPTPGIEMDSEIEIERFRDGWSIAIFRNVDRPVVSPVWDIWADNWTDIQGWYLKWETEWHHK